MKIRRSCWMRNCIYSLGILCRIITMMMRRRSTIRMSMGRRWMLKLVGRAEIVLLDLARYIRRVRSLHRDVVVLIWVRPRRVSFMSI